MFSAGRVALVATMVGVASAYPWQADMELTKRYDGFPDNLTERLGSYSPPGPNDSRGPCPALNTLANHGLLNHNGRDLTPDAIMTAFRRGFGINDDGIQTALSNFEIVCEYVEGHQCVRNGQTVLTNLTLLGEPHAFEHDHSFSRLDYHNAIGNGNAVDNIYFDSEQFQLSLDVVGYHPSNPPQPALADYSNFNEIRLSREAYARQHDIHGWFQTNIPVQEFEAGFIFGATFNRDSEGNMIGNTPMVRLDWWNFWFSEESFPTHLGWVPAHTTFFNSAFITSASRAILTQRVTSVPSGIAPSETATSQAPAMTLPSKDPSPTYTLFQSAPYAAPTKPGAIRSETARTTSMLRRADATAAPAITPDPAAFMASASSMAGPPPQAFNMYQQSLDVTSLRNQIAAAQSFSSTVNSIAYALAASATTAA